MIAYHTQFTQAIKRRITQIQNSKHRFIIVQCYFLGLSEKALKRNQPGGWASASTGGSRIFEREALFAYLFKEGAIMTVFFNFQYIFNLRPLLNM